MQYRHIYHAGNFADVFKHTILILLLEALYKKDKALLYLDTHAGIASYDLNTEAAQKTREYINGIGKILPLENCPAVIKKYQNIVNTFKNNDDTALHFYPGSPHIIYALRRPVDRMILVELHKEDVLALQEEFAKASQVSVCHLNGFQSIKAFLPPKAGRGLILMDPAFEDKNEFQNVSLALELAAKRFPIGVYGVWFPIKEQLPVKEFLNMVKNFGFKNILLAELSISQDTTTHTGLISCGMLIINAPWKFEDDLKPLVAWLRDTLALDASANYAIRWLLKPI